MFLIARFSTKHRVLKIYKKNKNYEKYRSRITNRQYWRMGRKERTGAKMKTKVLEILEQNRQESVSGSKIASKLQITRSAVWKTIEALRREGYQIEAVTNRGYRLCSDTGHVSAAGIFSALHTEVFGRQLHVEPCVDSTNAVAKQAAQQGAGHGDVVAAREQTGGRGRRNRTFFSPKDVGLYMSVVLRPECSAEQGIHLTTWAAVVVARAVELLTGLPVEIKWINDLYVQGKKICGILTEASMDLELHQLEYAVVGIGINVSTLPDQFPEELQGKAASLKMLLGEESPPSLNRLAAAILDEMERSWPDCFSNSVMEEYRRRSFLIGKEIAWWNKDHWQRVLVEDIKPDGSLAVITPRGMQRLYSGDIRLPWLEDG